LAGANIAENALSLKEAIKDSVPVAPLKNIKRKNGKVIQRACDEKKGCVIRKGAKRADRYYCNNRDSS
jgi:hypothetical protein